MSRVVILQEYVPQYRVPFFELLRDKGLECGIDIRVASGDAGSSLANRNDASSLSFGIPIQQVERQIAGRRVVVRRISHAIAGADLVILEQARRNVDAYRLLPSRRRNGPLVALWGHGKDFTRPTTLLDRRLSRWLTSKADWFFAYTAAGMNYVVADGFSSYKTTVVQNSIDSSALQESIERVTQFELERFAATHDLRGKTALFIGALDESKRLGFLRDAAIDAHRQEPNFRLLLAGDGGMRPQVEEWAGAFSWMEYLGPLTGHEKAVALASSDVLSMPGRVGLVAVDSFAAGIPIVTTDWPWHAPEFEYLENGRNAIVTLDDSASYTEDLLRGLRDPDVLKVLRKAARSDCHKYSVETMSNNFIEGIRGALASRRR
jgi:glycosyltransferase involved in cell wall biosynthesis